MKEYEVTFEMEARCKVIFEAKDDEDLWDRIDEVKNNLDIDDIEDITDIDVISVDEI